MNIPVYFYINFLFIVVWLFFNRRFRQYRVLLLLGWLMLFNISVELLAYLYTYYRHVSNHWVYNIYTTLQILFTAAIYKELLPSQTVKKKIKALSLGYLLLVIVNLSFFQSFFHFHTVTYVIGCVFIVYLCIAYFIALLHSDNLYPLSEVPAFWINCANLIYYTTSIVYMGSINFIVTNNMDQRGRLIAAFAYSFTAIQYILFLVSLLCTLIPKRK